MAGRLTFHYFPGHSVLHRWDARCKLAGLLVLTLSLLRMGWEGLALFSALFFGAALLARVPLRAVLREMRGWSIFLIILFLIQAFFHPGAEPPIFGTVPLSLAGLRSGAMAVWRLALVLGFAALFAFVTKPKDLQDAILWCLKPFPFLPARRIALMVTLTLRFLPLILDGAEEVKAATRARLGNRRRNPLLRAKCLVLPLVRRSLLRADELALALAARGYREDLPPRLPRLPLRHVTALFAFALVAAGFSTEIFSLAYGEWIGWLRYLREIG